VLLPIQAVFCDPFLDLKVAARMRESGMKNKTFKNNMEKAPEVATINYCNKADLIMNSLKCEYVGRFAKVVRGV